MRPLQFIVLCLLVVAIVGSVSSVEAGKKKKKKKKANPVEEEVPVAKPKPAVPPSQSGVPRPLKRGEDATKIPSIHDPKDREKLHCSVCVTALEEVDKRLQKVKLEFDRTPEKLKSYHVLASVDNLCAKEVFHYGLLRNPETKEVYAKYVSENDEKYSGLAVKGGWVTRTWQARCDEMLERIEDDLYDLYKGKEMDLCPMCKPVYEEERAAAEKAKKAAELQQQQQEGEGTQPSSGGSDDESKKEDL